MWHRLVRICESKCVPWLGVFVVGFVGTSLCSVCDSICGFLGVSLCCVCVSFLSICGSGYVLRVGHFVVDLAECVDCVWDSFMGLWE